MNPAPTRINRIRSPPHLLRNERILKAISELVFSLILGIAFWYQTTKKFERPCFGDSLLWANYAKYVYLLNAMPIFITLIFFRPILHRGRLLPIISRFVNITYVLTKLAGVPLMIGIFISFMHSDECPDLETITRIHFVLFLLILIAIALPAFMVCCFYACCGCFCLLAGLLALFGRPRQNNQRPRNPPPQQPSQADSLRVERRYLLPM